MKFSINKDEKLSEDEIVINHNTNQIIIDKLYEVLSNYQKETASLSLFKDDEQYFLNVNEILFFETNDNQVYAHTNKSAYESKLRLYELETMLPKTFIRISKSTICNIKQIYSISRHLTSNGLIKFKDTPKEVYVSRKYYPQLKRHLERGSVWEEENPYYLAY